MAELKLTVTVSASIKGDVLRLSASHEKQEKPLVYAWYIYREKERIHFKRYSSKKTFEIPLTHSGQYKAACFIKVKGASCARSLYTRSLFFYNENEEIEFEETELIEEQENCYVDSDFHSQWIAVYSNEYMIPDAVNVSKIEKGFILPMKHFGTRGIDKQGGVCDAEGNYIAGLERSFSVRYGNERVGGAYPFSREDILCYNETVVFGGVIFSHFGHFILESLTRLWWLLENPDCNLKVVFISHLEGAPPSSFFWEFMRMLDLEDDRIFIVDKPSQFKSIIIPDQSAYIGLGYTDKFIDIYNKIRDSVEPAAHRKIYLTRTQLPRQDTVGEKYFMRYYEKLGFKAIAPEKLPLEEQIAIMAGAEEVVCVSGTLQHLALFCRDGVKQTVLQRHVKLLPIFRIVDQARKIDATYVDVSMNFLPGGYSTNAFLLAPSQSWYKYIADNNMLYPDEDACLNDCVAEYIKKWARLHRDKRKLKEIASKKDAIVNLMFSINKYLLGEKLAKIRYSNCLENKSIATCNISLQYTEEEPW